MTTKINGIDTKYLSQLYSNLNKYDEKIIIQFILNIFTCYNDTDSILIFDHLINNNITNEILLKKVKDKNVKSVVESLNITGIPKRNLVQKIKERLND